MLDLITLQLVFVITHIVGTLLIILNWRLNPEVDGAADWAIGRLMTSIAVLIFALRAVLPPSFIVTVGVGVYFFGIYIVFVGVKRYMAIPILHTKFFVIAIAAFVATHAFVMLYMETTSHVVSIGTIILTALSCWALFSGKGTGVKSARFLGVVYVLHTLFFVGQLLFNLFLAPNDALGFDNPMSKVAFLEAIVVSTFTAMFFISMTAENLNAKLKHQAERDPLTGAFNRRSFFPLAEHALALSKREEDFLSIQVLDLDFFKNVNDTYGHVAGDGVLRHCVKQILPLLRAPDVLARLGGEEFIILCPCTDADGGYLVAERIRAHLAATPYRDGDLEIPITVSIGLATKADQTSDVTIEQMIVEADQALYQAKEAGRNRIVAVSIE